MTEDKGKMSVADAGRLGGLTTKMKHGIEHYEELGRQAGNRNKAKGQGYFQEIGRKGGLKRKELGADFKAMGKIGGNKAKAKLGKEHFKRMGQISGANRRKKKEEKTGI